MIGKTNAVGGGTSECPLVIGSDSEYFRIFPVGEVDTSTTIAPTYYSSTSSKSVLNGSTTVCWAKNDNGVLIAKVDGNNLKMKWDVESKSDTSLGNCYKFVSVSSFTFNNNYMGRAAVGTYTCEVVSGHTLYLSSPVELKFTVKGSTGAPGVLVVDLTYNMDKLFDNMFTTTSNAYLSGTTFTGNKGGGYLYLAMNTLKKIA